MMIGSGSTPFDGSTASRRAPMGAEGALSASFRADPERFSTNEEPRLDDLLNDPIITSLMSSDGVQRDVVCAVVRDVRARLGEVGR